MSIQDWTAKPAKLRVYGTGRGGAHRRTAEAARWRFMTTQAAQVIRAAHPTMPVSAAKDHAQIATEHAFHVYNSLNAGFGWPGYASR